MDAHGSPADRKIDRIVVGGILLCSALSFVLCDRAHDFYRDDVFYVDAARSLVEHGLYGIAGRPEANQPPGLSGILAAAVAVGVDRHVAFLRIMAVFEAVGFLACYAFLKRVASRPVAATICLLLVSSGLAFALATEYVSACYPFFAATMAALLVARKLDEEPRPAVRAALAAALAALVVAAILIASAGIALLGALAVHAGSGFLRAGPAGRARLRVYAPALAAGLLAQGLWMQRPPAPRDWPIPGYPQSYLSQLLVKSGNDPELGVATARDIPARIARNAVAHAGMLAGTLARHWIDESWFSVAVSAPLLLGAAGWVCSVARSDGVEDWYFAGYEFIYLLWPWDLEGRFFIPIAPLATLYVWRGIATLRDLVRTRPRAAGAAWIPLGSVLAAGAWLWMRGIGIAGRARNVGLQDEASLAFWIVSIALAVSMVSAPERWRAASPGAGAAGGRRIRKLAWGTAVGALCAFGLVLQVPIAHANLESGHGTGRSTADADAADWINAHTDDHAVLMARQVPTVWHHGHRPTVWFPPSSDPDLLMDGIRRHGVDYVIVVHRDYAYYRPTDDQSFEALLAKYAAAFRLVQQTAAYRIYRVVRGAGT